MAARHEPRELAPRLLAEIGSDRVLYPGFGNEEGRKVGKD
jgi:hypothetical protein